MNKKGLGFFGVAFMYIGTIMGAGFASGREIWQFFGVFGNKGIIGVILVGLFFVIIGVMTSFIALRLNTNNMGRVIVPAGNEKLVVFVSYFMAVILFSVMINMTSAGGALLDQEFGLNRAYGGAVIAILVIATLIGGFERVSHVFKYLMPILVIVVTILCISVIFSDISTSTNIDVDIKPSPLAKNFMISPLIYISYNVLALIPIVATAAINAKSKKQAIFGTALGGVFLGILAFILDFAMLKDAPFSHSMPMPMLAYSARLNPLLHIAYAFVLVFAIYASATGNFYGVTTKLRHNKYLNIKIIVLVLIAYAIGLVGFENVVKYMFPVEGFLGFGIIILLIINFIQVLRVKKTTKDNFKKTDKINLNN